MEKTAKLILDKISNVAPDYVKYCVAEAEYNFYMAGILLIISLVLLALSIVVALYCSKSYETDELHFVIPAILCMIFFALSLGALAESIITYKDYKLSTENPKGYAINKIIKNAKP